MTTLSKSLIEKLYYKKGLSTIEISKRLRISVWVVLGFMRRNNIIRRSFNEANRIYFEKKPSSFLIKKRLSKKEEKLKTAGVFLYWGEGAQLQGKNCSVDFANSKPEMVRVFLNFLRKVCGIDEKRLRVYLYCYSDQNIESLLNYWYKVTQIPLGQFTKPYIRKDFLAEKSGKMKYGLVHIRYADKKLLYKIDNWIKDYCKTF